MNLTSVKTNKFWKLLLGVMFFMLAGMMNVNAEENASKDVNVQELIFGHIKDAYSWHIITINGHQISIPLFVIVKGQNGWDAFCASKLENGNEYKGYYLCKSGDNEGKVVELDSNGAEVRPLDLSITKNVLTLFFIAALMLTTFLYIANQYKKKPLEAPSGIQGFLEPLIIAIDEGVTKACIGKNYKRYSNYILSVFFFVLLANYLGIVPIFPGGANLTGNIAITMVLACITFVLTNFTTNKHYWKDIFWPDVPLGLKCPIPIMQFIEFIGIFTKPIALCIRLFANMLSGHIMQLVLVGLIFIMTSKMGALVGAGTSIFSVLLAVFMDLLEVLVGFIQAYVFATLSSLFIGLAQERPEEEK